MELELVYKPGLVSGSGGSFEAVGLGGGKHETMELFDHSLSMTGEKEAETAQLAAIGSWRDFADANSGTKVEGIIETGTIRYTALLTEGENWAQSLEELFGLVSRGKRTIEISNF